MFIFRLSGFCYRHLCGNPDWSFLLSGLELNILSIDVYGCGEIFTRYADEVRQFLDAAWLAPARCCLINADGHLTVENAFRTRTAVSTLIRDKYDLTD